MTRSLQLNLEHITRVEGHGNIVINVKDGKIEESRLHVVESPRFFEAMLRGRHYSEAAPITSRICGICSVGHTLASLRASEAALGITPSTQTTLLRKLLMHGETLESHVLHAYFLVAPDCFGKNSVIPLVGSHPDVVVRALRMKRLGHYIGEVLAGRKIHTISAVVNGFTRIPKISELKELREKLEKEFLPDVKETAKLMATLKLPNFTRKTEYVALSKPYEYAFIDGVIKSSDGDVTNVQNYKDKIKEYVVKHSAAKHVKGNKGPIFVGALSRFNINHELLSPFAKEVAAMLGLKAPCYNPYMNTIAQVVEVVHCTEDAIRIIDELLEKGLHEEDRHVHTQAGRGAGAVEVPRGTLYHEYEYDDNGYIVNANCIIPTGQNLANIDADMEELVPQILDKPKDEIALNLEMLVRAYDPCISCATHMLDVKFINE
ncbi:MAG TPA: Ni/Fe hydrogenase subunit alpha [Candidatus Wallbacteria bacterium]|nr:Ni/Fe hydrogenase subunit alpha [Candidatus Wallbacteria bacterium]